MVNASQMASFDLGAVWRLVPYLIMESERARLLAMDCERLTLLTEYANYAVDSYLDADMEHVRPALAALLVSENIESEKEGRAADLYLPSAYMPAVELQGGSIFARWDVRPDTEADAVRARRNEIASTFFTQARLQAEELTASWEKATSFLGQVDDAEPWPVLPGLDVVDEGLRAELDGIYRERA